MVELQSILVTSRTSLRQALEILNRTASGVLIMRKPDGTLERTVTDGDIRRLLLEGVSLDESLEPLVGTAPIVIGEEYSGAAALELMNLHSINHLPVVDDTGKVIEILERKHLDEQILLSTPHLGSLEREFVEEAFRTNWIAPLGPNVDAFETAVADYVGAGCAAALSSGTAAIHLALHILGVRHGDTVFCSSFTFVASANPVLYQGATPVFIDSESESWNMSPQALQRAFDHAVATGTMPRAVIVVNLYGQSADMDTLLAICRRYDVPVIEDAAESLGARYKGKPSGTHGIMGVYSFNGNKIITTSGGGMLISDDRELIEKARFLSTQARDPAHHYQHSEVGFNYRMSNILAGVGRGQLEVLAERVASRRAIFQQYCQGFAHIEAIRPMPEPAWSFSTHWLSVITLDPCLTGIRASDVIRALADENIEARPTWKPMHLQPLFAGSAYFPHADVSVSDRLFEQGVCLPSGSNMNAQQVNKVINVIDQLFNRVDAA